MIATIILFIISVFLEGLIPNILRGITPFFVIAIIIIASFNIKNKKWFYIICFITGIIYDLIYMNTVFLHGFIYLFLAFLAYKILGKKNYFIKALASYFILVVTYVFIMILFTISFKTYTIYHVIHILYDGIVINILYFLLIYITYYVINRISGNRLKKSTY